MSIVATKENPISSDEPIKEYSLSWNRRTEACEPGSGSRSVMTSDPRLFLFFCSAMFIVLPFGHMITMWLCHFQTLYSSYRQKERGRGGDNDRKRCQPSLSLFIWKRKGLLRRPIQQTFACVLWAGSMSRSHAQVQKKSEKNVWPGTWPFCIKLVSHWQEYVLPISQ